MMGRQCPRVRRERGYWGLGGEGYCRIRKLLEGGATIAEAALLTGACWSRVAKISAALHLKRRHDRTNGLGADRYEAILNGNTQEIDVSRCQLAKAYDWKGRAYASVEAHVSRAGKMR
jgi:hypothetical protein